ncbi:MAG: class I SAM-dependent methyltransferase, partial [Pseudonocardiaceae bacterium]
MDEVVGAHHRDYEVLLAAQHREYQTALRIEIDRVIKTVTDVEVRDRRDLWAAGEREAAVASERFAREVMPKATPFDHPNATLEHALSLAPTGGMALEFGVYSGGTLRVIADARADRQVFGFDSFRGLPEDWRAGLPAGTFAVEQLPEVPGAELVVGLFDDTLADFLANHPGTMDFLHLDADLYSSTITVLDQVGPRLQPGSVIVFDEYFNYPGWEQHEHRAWQEYVAQSGTPFRYEAYTFNNEQVVVVVTGTCEPDVVSPGHSSRTQSADNGRVSSKA